MPIRVRYEVRCNRKEAALLTTYDHCCAMSELEHCRKAALRGDIVYIMTEVERVEPLTKVEEYLLLVYDVRRLQRAYFDGGRDKAIFQQALELERKLDLWNTRTRCYLTGHPESRPDNEQAFAFFLLVEKWREKWKAYFAYKKQRDADPDVVRERAKECRAYEAQIDSYIKKEMGV